jgi:MFS family permease
MADPNDPRDFPETDTDFGDLLQEIRILLNGVEVLTGFLIVLPFSEGFHRIEGSGRWVYLATFLCALTAVICFAAPAAQHRLMRPLPDRVKFKKFATRLIVAGLVPFSICLILCTQLVAEQVVGTVGARIVTGIVATFILAAWWVIPLVKREEHARHARKGMERARGLEG